MAYSLTMFVVVSVLAGGLVAGIFVPFVGLAGMGSKAAADELNSLPTELATPTPPTRSTVYMANGKVLAYFYDENRIPVEDRIGVPVDPHVIEVLRERVPEFVKAYDEDGLAVADFERFGATVKTLTQFLEADAELDAVVRDVLVHE